MITKITLPASFRKHTQYPSYQQLGLTFSLPAGKNYGITKRTQGLTPATILATGVTQMRADADADVNNGMVPFDKTWVTGTASSTNAIKADVNHSYNNATFANGANVVLNASAGVTTSDIISDIRRGLLKDGQEIGFSGLNVNISIPSDGTVRFDITNVSGATKDLSNTLFYVRIFRSVNEIAQNFYNFGIRKGTGVFSEFAENGIPANKVEQIYARLFQLIQQNEGVIEVNETNIFADYYDGLNGYSTGRSFLSNGETQASLEAGLASQVAARGNSFYYINQAYNYRNRFIGGYFDGIRKSYNAAMMFETFYNLEKDYIAMNNRKTAVFGWGSFEGVSGYIEARATQQRLRMPASGSQPVGDLIRTVRPEASFKMNEVQATFAILLGTSFYMWNDGVKYGLDLKCFNISTIGGSDPGKDSWQPLNGSIVQYNAGNSTHPQSVCDVSEAYWSDTAAPSQNGAYAGVMNISKVLNRCNISLKWATFNYVENGVAKSGYYNGDTPVLGDLGNAYVSRYGVSNPGQNNVVKQYYNKKMWMLEGHGTEGGFLLALHPHATLTGTKQYNVSTQHYGAQSFSHIGNRLGLYLLD